MNIPKALVQRAREERMADITLQMCLLSAVLTLNGKYGFGKKRLQEFVTEFGQTIKDYRGRYDEVALDALIKHAKEKGIEVNWK